LTRFFLKKGIRPARRRFVPVLFPLPPSGPAAKRGAEMWFKGEAGFGGPIRVSTRRLDRAGASGYA
jgi:hypothetical protein